MSAGDAAAIADDNGVNAAPVAEVEEDGTAVKLQRPHRSLLVSFTRSSMGPCAKMHFPFLRIGHVDPP